MDATDDEEESVLPTFPLNDIRLWEAGGDRVLSGTLAMSGISKDMADKHKEERILAIEVMAPEAYLVFIWSSVAVKEQTFSTSKTV